MDWMKLKDWEWVVLWRPILWVFNSITCLCLWNCIVSLITFYFEQVFHFVLITLPLPSFCLNNGAIMTISNNLDAVFVSSGYHRIRALCRSLINMLDWKCYEWHFLHPYPNNQIFHSLILGIYWSWRGFTHYSRKDMQGLGRAWYPSDARQLIKVLFTLNNIQSVINWNNC